MVSQVSWLAGSGSCRSATELSFHDGEHVVNRATHVITDRKEPGTRHAFIGMPPGTYFSQLGSTFHSSS